MVLTDRPALKSSSVLVRLAATGICGTDLGLASGKLGACRDILGHEGVGYVEQIGSAVDPSLVKLGDRVGITWLRDVCGVCPYCLHPGGHVRCQEQLNSGRKIDGTFAEYAEVPSSYLVALPASITLPDEQIAPILCGGVTAYSALKNCGGTLGQWVVISGAGGGVGALAVQFAKAMGYRVVAIDIGDAKRQLCLSSGADSYVDARAVDDFAGEIRKSTGPHGASVVLNCAGSGHAYNVLLDLVAPFGNFVCVGIPPPDELVSFHPLLLIDRGIKLTGSVIGSRQEILEALEFVQSGRVKPAIIVD
ncbi:hypothetical protein Golomagni_06209, partial [Golovinomyces magnicellulatus]